MEIEPVELQIPRSSSSERSNHSSDRSSQLSNEVNPHQEQNTRNSSKLDKFLYILTCGCAGSPEQTPDGYSLIPSENSDTPLTDLRQERKTEKKLQKVDKYEKEQIAKLLKWEQAEKKKRGVDPYPNYYSSYHSGILRSISEEYNKREQDIKRTCAQLRADIDPVKHPFKPSVFSREALERRNNDQFAYGESKYPDLHKSEGKSFKPQPPHKRLNFLYNDDSLRSVYQDNPE